MSETVQEGAERKEKTNMKGFRWQDVALNADQY